jgi:glycosyltransferase involved in cell wall biosynthesis
MRIAWCGPLPEDGSGAAYLGTQLLDVLVDAGHQVDAFLVGDRANVAAVLRDRPGLDLVCRPAAWDWDRWYSRTPLAAFVTGQLARGAAQLHLRRTLAARHRTHPYDVLYQFSQPEAMGLVGGPGVELPLVVHPGTYAAAELRWHRREAGLTVGTEPRLRHAAVRAMLAARAHRQRGHLRRARLVLAPSERFADDLAADYAIPRDRFRVVPNAVDLDRFRPGPAARDDGPLTILFVSRISVRKGVELVVALSRRLVDLAGVVRIVVAGGPTQWSDYTHLLAGLDPRTAEYGGYRGDTAALYRSAALVLQPSHFEPFALTVAEALACGVPVVATEVVGATEGVDPRACRTFGQGDLDAFERQVRGLVAELLGGARQRLAAVARAEAERCFSPRLAAARVAAALAEAADTTVHGAGMPAGGVG